jgi:hypothetical protein
MRVGVWLLSPSQGGLFLSIPTSKVIDNYEQLFRSTQHDAVFAGESLAPMKNVVPSQAEVALTRANSDEACVVDGYVDAA